MKAVMTIDDEVKKFLGLSPYDGSDNICKEDPIFYQSLCNIYGEKQVRNAIKAWNRRASDAEVHSGACINQEVKQDEKRKRCCTDCVHYKACMHTRTAILDPYQACLSDNDTEECSDWFTTDVQEVKHAKFELVNNGKGVCSNCHRLDSIDSIAKIL